MQARSNTTERQRGILAPLPFFDTGQWRPLQVLSHGMGQISTALALMNCENALEGYPVHPHVPVYDLMVWCDLGLEPPWVHQQAAFTAKVAAQAGIPFVVLTNKNLYQDYLDNFGIKHVRRVPFYAQMPDGRRTVIRERHCTVTYKIKAIESYVKFNWLGYTRRNEHNRPRDIGAHCIHIGYSAEEIHRATKKNVYENQHPFYTNRYPLIEMGYTREDCYRYTKEQWGIETRGSACAFCPFHQNYFYHCIKHECPRLYKDIVTLDNILEERHAGTHFQAKLFLSKSYVRIQDLRPEQCNDAQTFRYNGQSVWNGF